MRGAGDNQSPGPAISWPRREIAFGTVSFLVPALVLVLAYRVLTQRAGEVGFGVFALANGLAGTTNFMGLGLGVATVRFVAKRHVDPKRSYSIDAVLSTATTTVFAISLLVAAILILCAPFLARVLLRGGAQSDRVADLTLRLGATQTIPVFVADVYLSVAKGLRRFSVVAAYASMRALAVYGVATVLAIRLGRITPVQLMVTGLLGNVAALFLLAAIVHRLRGVTLHLPSHRHFDFCLLKRMTRFGMSPALVGIGSMIYYDSQRYIVGALDTPKAVTAYVVGFALVSNVHALVARSSEVLFPIASGEQNRNRLRSLYLRLLSGGLLVGAVLLAPLFIWAPEVCTLWLGASLGSAVAPLVRALALGAFAMVASVAPYHLCNGLGREVLNVWNLILRAAMFLTFLLVCTQWTTGVNAVAYAWTLAAVTVDVCLWLPGIELTIWRRKRFPNRGASA